MNVAAEAIPENDAKPLSKANGKATVKKRAIMSLGDKGGSSKSFLVRKLGEMHLRANTPGLMLVDGDQTVGALFRFYAERDELDNPRSKQGARGVQMFGLHGKVDARDSFVNDLLRRGADLVITDLPATSLTKLREISEEYDFAQAVTDAGYRLTIVAPITPYDDTILDLQEAIALIDPEAFAAFEKVFDAKNADATAGATAARAKLKTRADYVAVVNLGMAEDRHDFELWDAPDSFTRQLLAFVGGVEVEFPKLRPRIAAKLAKHRLSFAAGEAAEAISITDRSRLQKWNESAEVALRKAGDLLSL
jgi:hypothetical protein